MCQEVVETAEELSCYSLLIAVSSYGGPFGCLSTAGGVNINKWECEWKKTWKIFGTTLSPFFCYKVIAIYICIHRLFHFFSPLSSFHNKLELHLREKKVNLRGTTSAQITRYFIVKIIAFPARRVYQGILRENCVGPCIPVSVHPHLL